MALITEMLSRRHSCRTIILICVANKSERLQHLVLYEGLFLNLLFSPQQLNSSETFTVCFWANGIEALHHSRLTSISRLTVTPASYSSILYCCTKRSSPLNQTAALGLGCLAWLFKGWDCQANSENIRGIVWNT